MEEEKIIIEIDENGRITADLEGFKGEICETEIGELLEGIAEINVVHKKDDYFEEAPMDRRVNRDNINRLGGKEK